MSKKLIFYLSCTLAIIIFVLLRIGVVRASKPGQTNILKWQQDVRYDINTHLFQEILAKGDVEGARKLLEKYETQEPTKEANGETVVKEPLKEFLRQPFGNYPNIQSQMPIQGVFYDMAREQGSEQRWDNLTEIALLFIDKTDPDFFTNAKTKSLHEVPTSATSPNIPYLHFALKYGLIDVADALLNKISSLANGLVDGQSALIYAYEGEIDDPALLEKLVTGGAVVQEKDFTGLTEEQQEDYLAWLTDNDISLSNISGSPVARGKHKKPDGSKMSVHPHQTLWKDLTPEAQQKLVEQWETLTPEAKQKLEQRKACHHLHPHGGFCHIKHDGGKATHKRAWFLLLRYLDNIKANATQINLKKQQEYEAQRNINQLAKTLHDIVHPPEKSEG